MQAGPAAPDVAAEAAAALCAALHLKLDPDATARVAAEPAEGKHNKPNGGELVALTVPATLAASGKEQKARVPPEVLSGAAELVALVSHAAARHAAACKTKANSASGGDSEAEPAWLVRYSALRKLLVPELCADTEGKAPPDPLGSRLAARLAAQATPAVGATVTNRLPELSDWLRLSASGHAKRLCVFSVDPRMWGGDANLQTNPRMAST
eukprot:1195164-Prorocentrum_minimum.AAC.4